MTGRPEAADPAAVSLQAEARALGDPTRHAIFRYVAGAPEAVGVAELTELLGLNHNAIRQHLAKLVTAGLLAERTERAGRPGRPRLVYELAPGVESRWGPTGPYERLSVLLTEVIRSGSAPVEVGRRAGKALRPAPPPEQTQSGPDQAGGDAGTVEDPIDTMAVAMHRQGFQPDLRPGRGGRTELVLGSCPFASAALTDPDVICALHLGIAEGLAEGTSLEVESLVRKDPRQAGCRLLLRGGTT